MFNSQLLRPSYHDTSVQCASCNTWIAPDTGFYTQYMAENDARLIWLCRKDYVGYVTKHLDAAGLEPVDFHGHAQRRVYEFDRVAEKRMWRRKKSRKY